MMETHHTEIPFRVEGIDHVEFFVPDRREAAAWYREILGLEIVRDAEFWAEDPRGPLMISSDGRKTMLALFTGEPRGERATAGFHRVAFRVDAAGFAAFLQVAQAHSLNDLNGNPLGPASVSDHQLALSLYFQDPWGHRLEVTTYEVDAAREQ